MQAQPNYNITPVDNSDKVFGLTYKPTPSDREQEWDRSKVLLSKTDANGNILYANEAFIDVCGYDDFELMDKNHNVLRHPDMPKVIYKLMWANLLKGEAFHTIIKNMAKTGRYYWVVNDIKSITDSNGNFSYTGQQKAVEHELVTKIIEPLYKKLLQIEIASGLQSSENYLTGFLEERNKSYCEFIDGLIFTGIDSLEFVEKSTGPVKKKGFFSGFFADGPDAKKY